jgi:hypothetical protein
MIPSDDIDKRLIQLGKDRVWLAQASGYSEASVREALAPRSKKLSPRIHAAMSSAIEAAEAARTSGHAPDLEKIVLQPTSQQMDTWNQAALDAGMIIREWAMQGLDRLAADHHQSETLAPLHALPPSAGEETRREYGNGLGK